MKVTELPTSVVRSLADRARLLGERHRAAGIAPFGTPEYVCDDAGSADLLAALGETGPTTEENAPERIAAVEAYCGALEQMPPRADLEQAKRWAEIFNQEYARQGLPPLAAPRSLHELCEAARQANCGECWTGPGDECVFTTLPESLPVTPDTPVHPAKGYHVARFSRAMRRGLITGPELVAVPETAHGFTPATVYDRVLGGAR